MKRTVTRQSPTRERESGAGADPESWALSPAAVIATVGRAAGSRPPHASADVRAVSGETTRPVSYFTLLNLASHPRSVMKLMLPRPRDASAGRAVAAGSMSAKK